MSCSCINTQLFASTRRFSSYSCYNLTVRTWSSLHFTADCDVLDRAASSRPSAWGENLFCDIFFVLLRVYPSHNTDTFNDSVHLICYSSSSQCFTVHSLSCFLPRPADPPTRRLLLEANVSPSTRSCSTRRIFDVGKVLCNIVADGDCKTIKLNWTKVNNLKMTQCFISDTLPQPFKICWRDKESVHVWRLCWLNLRSRLNKSASVWFHTCVLQSGTRGTGDECDGGAYAGVTQTEPWELHDITVDLFSAISC